MESGFCSGQLLPSNLLVDRILSAQTCWLVTNISVFYFGVRKNFKEHTKRQNSKLKELAPDFSLRNTMELFQTSTTIHTATSDSTGQNLCLMQKTQKNPLFWETPKGQEIGQMVARLAFINYLNIRLSSGCKRFSLVNFFTTDGILAMVEANLVARQAAENLQYWPERNCPLIFWLPYLYTSQVRAAYHIFSDSEQKYLLKQHYTHYYKRKKENNPCSSQQLPCRDNSSVTHSLCSTLCSAHLGKERTGKGQRGLSMEGGRAKSHTQ